MQVVCSAFLYRNSSTLFVHFAGMEHFSWGCAPHPRRRTRSAKNKHCARLNTVLKLKDFTRATDRRVDSARVQVQGFGHSQASKAV